MAAESFILALPGAGVEQAPALRQLGERLRDPRVPNRRVARSDPLDLRIQREELDTMLQWPFEKSDKTLGVLSQSTETRHCSVQINIFPAESARRYNPC